MSSISLLRHSDMMEMEEEVKKKAEDSRKAEERILGLMKDKDSNEKEIKERDKTIADKEQRIFDLKKQMLSCTCTHAALSMRL